MSAPALTTKPERRRAPLPERRRSRRGAVADTRCRDASGPTLEDEILAAYRDLAESGRATCPVCAGEQLREAGCGGCGAELA